MPDFDWPFLGYSELPNNRFWLVISPDIGLLGAKKAGRNSSAEIRNGPSREGGQNLIKSSLGSKWLKVTARSFFPIFGHYSGSSSAMDCNGVPIYKFGKVEKLTPVRGSKKGRFSKFRGPYRLYTFPNHISEARFQISAEIPSI